MAITLADVETARRMLAGAALRTPMLAAPKLPGLTGAEVSRMLAATGRRRGHLNRHAPGGRHPLRRRAGWD